MIIAFVLLGMMVADGCPIYVPTQVLNGSCCDLKPIEVGHGFFYTSAKSGVYDIINVCRDCDLQIKGYCEASSGGGGWLVIQRRKDGSVNFNRNWVDYENGFGNLTSEFWYGLHAINCLTSQGAWELRIDYTLTDGTKDHLLYSNFRVSSAAERYKLSISGHRGVKTDPFKGLNGMKFTTKDVDNDNLGSNCAINNGGWWYDKCSLIYLNTRYRSQHNIFFTSQWYSLKFVEMKIKPRSC